MKSSLYSQMKKLYKSLKLHAKFREVYPSPGQIPILMPTLYHVFLNHLQKKDKDLYFAG